MNGKIIIDGNKDKVESNSQLIQLKQFSELAIYDNVILCNNLNKIRKTTTEYGSAISVVKSKINIYGGEISNNIYEIYVDKNSSEAILPEIMENDYIFEVRGVVIFMNCAKLYMYGGKISNNEGINNTNIFSNIFSNKNSTNSNNNQKLYGLYQRYLGIAIYSEGYSKIYLYKGEISNNYAENNAKSNLIEPIEKTITKLSEVSHCIYGSGLYFNYTDFEMFDDFIFQNNNSILDSDLTIEKNCKISNVNLSIRGGQIFGYASQIKIHGGTIQNTKYISNKNINIAPEEEEVKKNIGSTDFGGGIDSVSNKDVEINNLIIKKCKSMYGGAIYLSNSSMKISNSEFDGNIAEGSGGAIYSSDDCEIELYNNKILNNYSQEGSGGGIYAYGSLIIDGEKNLISNNVAGTNGGGIIIKNTGLIKNCSIYNNKAKNSGGGIYIDGNLLLEKAKIYLNSCGENGGGIYCASKILYDKDKIDSMVYDNTAAKNGNNLYL